MLSAFGAGTLVGALSLGWLSDRIGPTYTLALYLGVATGLWLLLSATSEFPLLIVLATLIGMGAGATVALHSAAMTDLFGPATFSRAMGYSYLLKMPFMFGAAPLSGHLYDISGGYMSTLLFYAGALAFATVVAGALALDRRRPTALTNLTSEGVAVSSASGRASP